MPVIDLGSVVGPAGPQGVVGATGATGATGPAGPNQVTGSTSTPLNGILQGNGSVIQAVQSDSAPTAGSNNIVRSGVVFDSLQRKSNHNMLINWYFVGGGTGRYVFPINTQGQASYPSGITYFIDGWSKHADIGVTLESTRLALTSQYVNQNIRQYLPVSLGAGHTVTFSVLISADSDTNCTLGHDLGSNVYGPWNDIGTDISLISYTFDVPASASEFGLLIRGAYPTTTFKIYLYAAKLEYGSVSTLAHQENGVWVLNDAPDWNLEDFKAKAFGFDLDPAWSQMIAPVERGSTASRQYTTGKLFVWRGDLYRATTTIDTNTPFNEGANCEKTTIAALMNL